MKPPLFSAKKRLVLLGSIFFFMLIVSLFADHLTPHDPYVQDLSRALSSPGIVYPFGTDRYGRCIFSRVLTGAKTTLLSALLLVGVSGACGSVIGILSALCGGFLDRVLMSICDVFLAFPEMIFAVAVVGVTGSGLRGAVIAIALVSWPKYARLARSEVLRIRKQPYLHAARMSGCTQRQLIFEQIMPNAAAPVIVMATLGVGTAMIELAGLSFLGLGAAPPAAEWGAMIGDGKSLLQVAPWVVAGPGIAILFSVIIFHLLGDALRDALDPKHK